MKCGVVVRCLVFTGNLKVTEEGLLPRWGAKAVRRYGPKSLDLEAYIMCFRVGFLCESIIRALHS